MAPAKDLKKKESRDDKVKTSASSCEVCGSSPHWENFSLGFSENPSRQEALGTKLFYEDEIYSFDRYGQVRFGLVVQGPDTYSDDELSDEPPVLKGQVRVALYPEGDEDVHPEEMIGVADRTVMPGDIVGRVNPGNNPQRGYCKEIKVSADVEVLGRQLVVQNVAAERLRLLGTWPRDIAVSLDSWIGSTQLSVDKIVLRSPSGSCIEILSDHLEDFCEVPSNNTGGIFEPHILYPGNKVIGDIQVLRDNGKLLTPDKPLPKNRKTKIKFTVESVYTESVSVWWHYMTMREMAPPHTLFKQPNRLVTGDDLKRLKRVNIFEPAMLQINDRNYVRARNDDVFVSKSAWQQDKTKHYTEILLKEQAKLLSATCKSHNCHNDKLRGSAMESDAEDDSSLASGNDIVMQDVHDYDIKKSKSDTQPRGRESLSLSSTCNLLLSSSAKRSIARKYKAQKNNTYDLTMLSGKNSPRKKSSGNTGKSTLPAEGEELITETLLVRSIATVIWQDGTIESNVPSTDLFVVHSVDNQHEYFPGDYVISGAETTSFRDYGVIQTVDHCGRTARVKWFTTYEKETIPTKLSSATYRGESEVSVYDVKEHPDFVFKPGSIVVRTMNFFGEEAKCTAGQVIENCLSGQLRVRWSVDGYESLCWPQDIFEVSHLDDGSANGSEFEEDFDEQEHNHGKNHESKHKHGEENDISSDYVSVSDNDSVDSRNDGEDMGFQLAMAESHVMEDIEQALIAIARLGKFLNDNPNLQNVDLMKTLMKFYQSCRSLDRLTSTNFFHVDNFNELVERVKMENMRTEIVKSPTERTQTRKVNRAHKVAIPSSLDLLSPPLSSPPESPEELPMATPIYSKYGGAVAIVLQPGEQFIPPTWSLSDGSTRSTMTQTATENTFPLASLAAMGLKRKAAEGMHTEQSMDINNTKEKTAKSSMIMNDDANNSSSNNKSLGTDLVKEGSTAASNGNTDPLKLEEVCNVLLDSAIFNIDKAYDSSNLLKFFITTNKAMPVTVNNTTTMQVSQEDSGNYSRIENCDESSTGYVSSLDVTPHVDSNGSMNHSRILLSESTSSVQLKEDVVSSELASSKFCTLLEQQLIKYKQDIRQRSYLAEDLNVNNPADNAFDEVLLSDRSGLDSNYGNRVENDQFNEDGKQRSKVAPEEVSTGHELKLEEMKAVPSSEPRVESEQPKQVVAADAINVPVISSVDGFKMMSTAPRDHKFYHSIFNPHHPKQYYKAVQREYKMLKSGLPSGIWVRVFEDRMDLLNVMIEGPKNTPYENGMFFFEMQLGADYPKNPPVCHYVSYCTERLNPNLYEDGKVCVSLLGTWSGRDTEVWGPSSTLLQVLVSIQGLILVSEPYYNEAGYDNQRGSIQTREFSKTYNEMVIIKLVQATTKMLRNPPKIFIKEILEHFRAKGSIIYDRLSGWIELSKQQEELPHRQEDGEKTEVKDVASEMLGFCFQTGIVPDFPLLPVSRGFCISLTSALEAFKASLSNLPKAEATSSNEENPGSTTKEMANKL